MSFKGKNSSNIEYDLFSDLYGPDKLYYGDGEDDYYAKIQDLTRYVNGSIKFEGTFYRDYFKSDPWIKKIETNYYYAPPTASTAFFKLDMVVPETFVNFKECVLWGELQLGEIYRIKASSFTDSDDIPVVSNDIHGATNTCGHGPGSSIIVLQAGGGNGGTAGSLSSSGSGGGSGAFVAFIFNPSYFSNYKYLYLSTTNSGKITVKVHDSSLGIVELIALNAGKSGKSSGDGGLGGTIEINDTYKDKAFWILEAQNGVAGGKGGSSDHAPGSDVTPITVTSTNSTTYMLKKYNHKVYGQDSSGNAYKGGADDPASALNQQTGGGGASFFAAGGAGATSAGSNGKNGNKGSGGGGGASSNGAGGTGGKPYFEIYYL